MQSAGIIVTMLIQNNIYQEHWVQYANQRIVMVSALQVLKKEEVCTNSWTQVLIIYLGRSVDVHVYMSVCVCVSLCACTYTPCAHFVTFLFF